MEQSKDKTPDWSRWRCRCSAISKILTNSQGNAPLTELQEIKVVELEGKQNNGRITEKQLIELGALLLKREKSKDVILSDSTVAYLTEAYAYETEGMISITKEMDVEYFDRGRKTEPESIELLSFVDNTAYVKNEFRFENDFLSGIPDVVGFFEPEDLTVAVKSIKDIKSCRDYPTFLYKIHKGLDPGNEQQLQGYGDILDCDDLGVCFTLPNMPEDQRNGYAFKLAQKMGCATTDAPEFKKEWAKLERSMIFKCLPPEKRVYKVPVTPFSFDEKVALYDRVKQAREWLFNFDIFMNKLNK
jgi:hypothetical protein